MIRASGAALLALATFSSGCLPSGARVLDSSPVPGLEVSVDESFYGVGGVTAWELNHELFRRGPRRAGVRWQGLTDFRVAYSFLPEADVEGCRAAEPRVRVEVVTRLPRWNDRELAPEPLRSDWDLYLGRLREHEEGHQRIAIDAGQALLSEVSALQAPDCEALRSTAQAVADAHQASITLEQSVWDYETAHGLAGGS